MRTEDVKATAPLSGLVDVTTLEINGREVAVDVEGFLLDVTDWDRDVTEWMAAQDGIELSEDHWILIDFLHRFYREYRIAPDMPILSRRLCKDQKECRWSRKHIRKLFPMGAKHACRYAGLPAPVGRSCI